MKYSYDYDELINELESDLLEGLIALSDTIKIVRSTIPAYKTYLPIIDYYYDDNDPGEEFEVMQVSAVLKEMYSENSIL